MYKALFDQFGRECAQRIAKGETLEPKVARAFCMLLEARERSGHRFLGAMAGPDAPFDTVTGRCGHMPAWSDIPG